MISKRYKIINEEWRTFIANPKSLSIRHTVGFLSVCSLCPVKIITESHDNKVLQGKIVLAGSGEDYEYLISPEEAEDLIEHKCLRPIIIFDRYSIVTMDQRYSTIKAPGDKRQQWYLDIYQGDQRGLVTCEVELKDENEELMAPPWVYRGYEEEPLNDLDLFNGRGLTPIEKVCSSMR